MRVLVTGASGFIGGNVARALTKHGYAVRVLLRPESRREAITGLDVETAYGDLADRPSLERALDGCDALVHTAAIYTLWTPDPAAVYSANVDSTRNILTAARRAGVRRVVFTSLGLQHPDGYWAGELGADASVTAGYVPLMYWMEGKCTCRRKVCRRQMVRQAHHESMNHICAGDKT